MGGFELGAAGLVEGGLLMVFSLFVRDTGVPRELGEFLGDSAGYPEGFEDRDWRKVSPAILGERIEATDEERAEMGIHYTSEASILKVLNPLFLDDLREQKKAAGDSIRKLTALSDRVSQIKVFDPACGAGNFLIVAYKEMMKIAPVPLSNFYGIELQEFPAKVARLSLIIAMYQCGGGQDERSHIVCGNALRMSWEDVCPLDGEVYVCGNPPYRGSTWQSQEQKEDLRHVFSGRAKNWKSLDYVAGWFMKAAGYGADSGLVSTNSICQGQSVPILWPLVFETGCRIHFAYTSFKWCGDAGVTVAIIGLSR